MRRTCLATHLCALALRTWPAALRHRHGRALRQTFLAAWQAEQRAPRIRRAWRRVTLVGDLILEGLRARAKPATSAMAVPTHTRENRMSAVVWDLRAAVRALRVRPLFTLAVVATLGLGLGSTTAIFAVVDAVLLRPLPYPEDHRLIQMSDRDASRNLTGASWPAFVEWQAFPEIESAAAWEVSPLLFGSGAQLERVQGAAVSPAFFSTLGVAAGQGRALLPGDPPFKPELEIVLGYDLWQRQFGADPAVVGRVVMLDGQPHTVVGVMPRGFAFPAGTEFWRSMPPAMRLMTDMPTVGFLEVIARLRPTATPGEVSTRLAAWDGRQPAGRDRVAFATDLRSHVRGAVGPALVAVFIGVVLLLAVACANVAALVVANGRARRGDLEMRMALGASRGRLVRQLLGEGLVLSLAGAAAALVVTRATRDTIVRLSADQIPRIDGLSTTLPVIVFTGTIAMAVALAVALGPAWSITRSGGRRGPGTSRAVTGSRATRRLFGGLVALEFALSLVLVAAAGLLLASYRQLLAADRGMSIDRVGVARVVLPSAGAWRENDTRRRLFEDLGARLETVPGIERAGFVARLPLDSVRGGSDLSRPDRPGVTVRALNQMASAGYFDAVGARLLAGRGFSAGDQPGAPLVVVLNDVAAAGLFGDPADAVGRSITYQYFRGPVTATVVGVVGAIRYESFATDFRPEMYIPVSQGTIVPLSLVYRATGDPIALVPSIRRVLADVDATGTVALDGVSTLEAAVARVTARPRFFLVLVGVFAALAFLLAACGVYGVTAYWVAERWRELGLRVALGATPRRVVSLLVGRVLALATIGIAAGLGIAWLGSGTIRHLLFGVEPGDPATLAAAGLALAAGAALAGWLPARRAGRIDPIEALRAE